MSFVKLSLMHLLTLIIITTTPLSIMSPSQAISFTALMRFSAVFPQILSLLNARLPSSASLLRWLLIESPQFSLSPKSISQLSTFNFLLCYQDLWHSFPSSYQSVFRSLLLLYSFCFSLILILSPVYLILLFSFSLRSFLSLLYHPLLSLTQMITLLWMY